MSHVPTMTAEEMRAIRARMGLSVQGMAVLLGVARRTLQHWEDGDRQIKGPVVILARKILAEHAVHQN